MVSMQSYIREEVRRGYFPEPYRAEAFSAYAIASSMGLDPEMERAARLTMDLPLTFESLGEELRLFTGSALHNLMLYHANLHHGKAPFKTYRRKRVRE